MIYILYTEVNFLELMVYYSYVKCTQCGKLGEGSGGPLCTIFATSYDYNYFKIKVEDWGCGSVVELLPDMHEALHLIPSNTKNK